MDINDLRGLSTVFVMIAFIGICWWAFAPRRKQRFKDAANLPFADEDKHQQAQHVNQADVGDDTDAVSVNKKQD